MPQNKLSSKVILCYCILLDFNRLVNTWNLHLSKTLFDECLPKNCLHFGFAMHQKQSLNLLRVLARQIAAEVLAVAVCRKR